MFRILEGLKKEETVGSHVYMRIDSAIGFGGQDLLRCSGRCGGNRRVSPTVKNPECQERHRLDMVGASKGP